MEADEYSFDPGRVDRDRGAGSSCAITLDNVGTLAHNIRVLDGDRELGGLRSFPSGEERERHRHAPARQVPLRLHAWATTRSWG